MERRVAIIGAGTSGLVACKYLLEKGFHPIVFESQYDIGGLWRHTIESTKLQNHKEGYRFTDFPWHSSVTDDYPRNQQVTEYLKSYAEHFAITPYIRFNSKVIDIDFVGESIEEMKSWDLWGGIGKPFGSKGKWHIAVQGTKNLSTEVYEVEFVVICNGKFSGVPNIPEFPPGKGPEIFKGKVMHSMDFSAMENKSALDLIKRKRVTVVGSQKSALDIAAECANANGFKYPCTMIQRNAHWFLNDEKIWGINLGSLYFNRFSELLVHKPGESFLLGLVATLLYHWHPDISSCQIGMLPENFFDQVKEGSIVMKRSHSFSFCRDGLMINGESKTHEADIVIFATGYKGDQKLKSIFKSPTFQSYFNESATSAVSLYRHIIHARIPQVAIIGYAEGLSNLFASEMRCQWLAQLLDGGIELPSIREMEKNIKMWEDHIKLYGGRYYWRSCIGNCNIWYNDQLCKDMGCNLRRKKGLFAELFQTYGPTDYAGLTHK